MKKARHLIAGAGLVGKAIGQTLIGIKEDDLRGIEQRSNKLIYKTEDFGVRFYDPNIPDGTISWAIHCTYLHICFPYRSDFLTTVRRYQGRFNPEYTVVHSTVPVGICDSLQACHSPVRGPHDRLYEYITEKFPKWFGGIGSLSVVQEFKGKIPGYKLFESAEVTEAMKLWETTQLGMFVLLEKEIYRWCLEHGLPFDYIYTAANEEYNEAYEGDLAYHDMSRPIMLHEPGPIGGTCVLRNAELLYDSYIATMVRDIGRLDDGSYDVKVEEEV